MYSFVPIDASAPRSEEHTSELQSRLHLVCRLLLEKKKIPQPDLAERDPQIPPASFDVDLGSCARHHFLPPPALLGSGRRSVRCSPSQPRSRLPCFATVSHNGCGRRRRELPFFFWARRIPPAPPLSPSSSTWW